MSSPSPRRSRPGLIAFARPGPPRRKYRFDQIDSLEQKNPARAGLLDPGRQQEHGVMGACGQTTPAWSRAMVRKWIADIDCGRV